jgi:hypothetical protein
MNGSQPSRLSLALDFACAAMLILVSGSVADTYMDTSIVPLEEEFADIWQTGKHVHERLVLASFTDLNQEGCRGNNGYRESRIRLKLMRRTAIMPSVAIRAFAEAIDVDPDTQPRVSINLSFHARAIPAVAREIGADERFIRLCWQTDADLDEQWYTLRNELLKIRSEWAVAL